MCSPPARDSTSRNLRKTSLREKSTGVYLPTGWVFELFDEISLMHAERDKIMRGDPPRKHPRNSRVISAEELGRVSKNNIHVIKQVDITTRIR